MSPDFVRYSPEIETFDPKLSEYMTRVLHYWQTKVRESSAKEGSGRAVRHYEDDFKHTPVADGLHGFQHNMSAAEDEILGRNRRRPHTYDYLRPSLVPNSTNI